MTFDTKKEAVEYARRAMRRTRREHGYRLLDENKPDGKWEMYAIEVDPDVEYLRNEIKYLKDEIEKLKRK